MKLTDKVVLVTGGTRGIGKAIVQKLAQAGANVAFTYVSSEEKARQLETELQDLGVTIKGYSSNAASYEESETLVKTVVEEFGTIDVLVNNAGITKDNLILRMNEEQWQSVIHTNLQSVFNLSKQVLRPMMRKRNGSIINISSIVGIKGNAGQANYAASKAGIIGFSKSLAQELGSRNIRCNVVAPGFIETEMTDAMTEEAREKFMESIPLKRLGKAEEVAELVLFLASDHATYLTGQTIGVCGGLNI